MISEEKLQKHYNKILDKLVEMIPTKWTRVLLYAEETDNRNYADFYFYTEDGKLHEFVNIDKEYNQSYRTLHDHMDALREINKELWLEFVTAAEKPWCTYSMEVLTERKYSIKYSYEFYDAPGVGARCNRWAYDEFGIIPKSIVDKRMLREWLEENGRPIPEEMYSREKVLYISPAGNYYCADELGKFQEQIDKYNHVFERENVQLNDYQFAIHNIEGRASNGDTPIFQQAMVILLLAYEERKNYRGGWTRSAGASLTWDDKEFCRELVLYAIKQSCKSDVVNSSFEYNALSKETKDEHVADIIGMIIAELSQAGELTDTQYEEILTTFAEPVQRWRRMEVPKARQQESYELLTQLMELCLEHKAYVSALRMSGMLYVADTTKNWDKLAKTMMLTGRIVYELGFLEVAKRCFRFAEQDTDGACFEGVEKKYKALLQQDTKVEITDEIRTLQKKVDEIFSREDVILYSDDEHMDMLDGELALPPYGLTGSDLYYLDKKIAKARKRLSDKALKKYNSIADGTLQKHKQGIQKAFALFKEEPEVYECSVQLYMQEAHWVIEEQDYEAAYEYFYKAYDSKEGKFNPEILFGMAVTLKQLGKDAEAKAYFLRAYIIGGETPFVGESGEEGLRLIQPYILQE